VQTCIERVCDEMKSKLTMNTLTIILITLLILLSACRQPARETVVEKLVVQCWDGSTAVSIQNCPPLPIIKEKKTSNAQITTTPAPEQSSKYACSYNFYNCDNFNTQAEAQKVFEACGGTTNDVHHLDRDVDGVACETLP